MASILIAGYESGELKVDPEPMDLIIKNGLKMPPTHAGSDSYEQHIYFAMSKSKSLRNLSNESPDYGQGSLPVDILLFSTILYHIEIYNLNGIPKFVEKL
ncbi:MAG: hypothetical protein HQL62_00670 [Magnetococcales bacterium]|nr:hypothetical protein [Magnetococcales bacterium]